MNQAPVIYCWPLYRALNRKLWATDDASQARFDAFIRHTDYAVSTDDALTEIWDAACNRP